MSVFMLRMCGVYMEGGDRGMRGTTEPPAKTNVPRKLFIVVSLLYYCHYTESTN